MAKDKENDTLFIATAAAVGLFLIFKGKSGQTAGGIGAAATAAGILRSIEEIDRLESEISLLETGVKYTEADRRDDRLVHLMGETRDRIV